MKIMIVESPNKVKNITKYLNSIPGEKWSVFASSGHFRDLSPKDLSIDLNKNMNLIYEYTPDVRSQDGSRIYSGGKKRIDKIRDEIKTNKVTEIYLATDPDREGEAIAWHLKECLSLKDNECHRVTFTAITKDAIIDALNKTRQIDMNLVKAQEARRCLDRLIGWKVSPIVKRSTETKESSAGRVQSPALKIVVDRQNAIDNFKKQKHYSGQVFFDDTKWFAVLNTKLLLEEGKEYITDKKIIESHLECQTYKVIDNEIKTKKRNPPHGFSTSLLLQVASVKLGLKPSETTKLAQSLFEDGFVTYIRTDGINIDPDALICMRDFMHNNDYELCNPQRTFKSKILNAQEAHECIRPTSFHISKLDDPNNQKKQLYEIIWARSIATQMMASEYELNTIVLENINTAARFIANTKRLIKKGWLEVYTEDDDDEEEDTLLLSELPPLKKGDIITKSDQKVIEKTTSPPKRYTEASLVKELESEGIGRPSTYASTMGLLTNRKYLIEEKGFLKPSELGFKIVDVLQKQKFDFIELTYTREMEALLDDITNGKKTYLDVTNKAYQDLKKEYEALGLSIEPKPYLWSTYTCQKCNKDVKRFQSKNVEKFVWFCSNKSCNQYYEDDPINIKPIFVSFIDCPNCLPKKEPLDKIFSKKTNLYYFRCKKCETWFDDANGLPKSK